ncbi:MAG: T9SS type A sorting domain-containing protein [Balneolaceae bacterium]|nr:T9SS type A sorting domain-containing protein [Balneolaceae bacterium]
MDAAIGAGLGLDLGFSLKYFDEIEYPTNYIEIYNGGLNYPVRSGSYNSQMSESKLTDILTELLSGTQPLIKEAFSNLINVIDKAIEPGKEFVADAVDKGAETIGKVKGKIKEGGQFIITTLNPFSNSVVQKAFETPKVRKMYSNPNVFYELPAKSVDDNETVLAEAGSELIVISDVMDLVFKPEGSSDSLIVLEDPIEIEMIIYESDLTDNDFDESDKESVNLYRYLSKKIGWVRVESELNDDVVSADITTLGSYALGIEINRSDDSVAPEIYESGYLEAADNQGVDEIFARVRDDRYGTGVDFGNTFMIVNEDTVSYFYQPANERIFFNLTNYSNLTGETEEVKIVATDFTGNQSTETFSFERVTTNTDDESELPDRFVLHDNYPNPFNPQTVIPFELAEATHVEINIYDVAGRYITTLLDERVSAGSHQVTWDISVGSGRELSSGVYFYQVKSGSFNQVNKMMLIK